MQAMTRDISVPNNAADPVPLAPIMRSQSPYLVPPVPTTMREPGTMYATVFSLAPTPLAGSSNPRTSGERSPQQGYHRLLFYGRD